jgi:CCR4-NOT transcription complex subunit 4
MSDDGDCTCPLCAEEMDITDQQLKPCKCGYDVITYPSHLLTLNQLRLLYPPVT